MAPVPSDSTGSEVWDHRPYEVDQAGLAQRLRDERLRYVRVVRSIEDAEAHTGFVLEVGRRWVLLSQDSDYRPDGFVCLRLGDIERIQPEEARHRIAQASWEAAGVWPPAPPPFPVHLDRTGPLLDSLTAGLETPISIDIEYRDPDVRFVGVLQAHETKDFTLEEISHEARWTGTLSRWTHSDVSQIQFLTPYAQALARDGGPPPT